jgi:hypothetical protein
MSHSLDSFLLSRRRDDKAEESKFKSDQQQFKYMIFVWNGKNAGAMVKAMALTKGYELDGLLSKGRDNVLQVLFAGGVIRGKKLQRGSVYIFDEVIDKKRDGVEEMKENPNAPSVEQIMRA